MNSNDVSGIAHGQATTPLRAALILIVLCGGVYPVVMTLFGGALFPHQATGSIIRVDGKAVGSDLVGQPFTSARYFCGRPSAAGHDLFSLAGSNWSPSNPDLAARVRTDAKHIAAAEGFPRGIFRSICWPRPVPASIRTSRPTRQSFRRQESPRREKFPYRNCKP